MASLLSRIINFYSRIIGQVLMYLTAALVLAGLIFFAIYPNNLDSSKFFDFSIQGFNFEPWYNIIWIAFLLNSLILGLNGVFVSVSFDREVRKLRKQGIPINSASGFRNLERKYKSSNLYLLFLLLFASVSYIFYLLAGFGPAIFTQASSDLVIFSLYLAISGIIFAIAAAIIIRVPILTGLDVGNLIQYYMPSRHPYILNSLILDGVSTLLDPITRVYFLQLSEKIANSVVEDFAPKLEPAEDRKPLAVQNVLILLYMHYRFPDLLDKDELEDEIERIVPKDTAKDILKKEELDRRRWMKIFDHLLKQTPEIFLIVDRIVLTLIETPEVFDSKEYWVSSAVPPIQKKEEAQDIVFFILNRMKSNPEPQTITMEFSGADELSPHDLSTDLVIRGYDSFVTIPKDTSKFRTEEKRQLIRLLTAIIYQGTGIWISAHSENIGSNIVALTLTGKNQTIGTQIFNLKVVRDFKHYIQSWGPKILASLGVVLPIVRAMFGL